MSFASPPPHKLWKPHWYHRRRYGKKKFNLFLQMIRRHNHLLLKYRRRPNPDPLPSDITQIFLAPPHAQD